MVSVMDCELTCENTLIKFSCVIILVYDTNTYAKITEHNNGFSKIARVNGICPYDGRGLRAVWYSPLRWGGLRANGIKNTSACGAEWIKNPAFIIHLA